MKIKIDMFLAPIFFFKFHCATWLRVLSWLLTTVVPIIFLSTQYSDNIIIGALTFYCVLCIYDIGYIYNDVLTFRKEDKKQATDRLGNERGSWETQIKSIILVRLGQVMALLSLLIYLDAQIEVINSLCMLGLTYYMYNSVRGVANLIIYPFLNFLKYFPYLLALTKSSEISVLYALTLYTIPTFLCWLGKAKFRKFIWQEIFAEFDNVRLWYFITLGIILYFLYIDKAAFQISMYMLVIRIIFYFANKNTFVSATLNRVRVK